MTREDGRSRGVARAKSMPPLSRSSYAEYGGSAVDVPRAWPFGTRAWLLRLGLKVEHHNRLRGHVGTLKDAIDDALFASDIDPDEAREMHVCRLQRNNACHFLPGYFGTPGSSVWGDAADEIDDKGEDASSVSNVTVDVVETCSTGCQYIDPYTEWQYFVDPRTREGWYLHQPSGQWAWEFGSPNLPDGWQRFIDPASDEVWCWHEKNDVSTKYRPRQ